MEQEIINNEDYKLKVRKTWVEITKIWHIEFLTSSVFENRFELFLTDNELQKLKDLL